MVEVVEMQIAFLEELPPLKGLKKELVGFWDEPDGGCEEWRLRADRRGGEEDLAYHLALLGSTELPGGRERWALGELEADWKGFVPGSAVLYRDSFLEWIANSFWVFVER
jgi:hypothetical protein